MEKPLIQKILNLTKYTFARQPGVKRGCRKRILDTEAFARYISELTSLTSQVRNKKFRQFK